MTAATNTFPVAEMDLRDLLSDSPYMQKHIEWMKRHNEIVPWIPGLSQEIRHDAPYSQDWVVALWMRRLDGCDYVCGFNLNAFHPESKLMRSEFFWLLDRRGRDVCWRYDLRYAVMMQERKQ